jgi:hypothetical protein
MRAAALSLPNKPTFLIPKQRKKGVLKYKVEKHKNPERKKKTPS